MQSRIVSWLLVPLLVSGIVWSKGIPSVIAQPVVEQTSEVEILFQKGNQQAETKQYLNAIKFWEEALVLYQKSKNQRGEANILMNIGVAYTSLSEHSKAIENYQGALLIFQNLKDEGGEATALGKIGMVYSDLLRHDKAIEHYQQALPIFRKLADYYGESVMLIGLSEASQALFQYDEAIHYYEQLVPTLRRLKVPSVEAEILMRLGLIYKNISQYFKSSEILEQSLNVYQKIGNSSGEVAVLTNLGGVYDLLGQHAKAIKIYQEALLICEQTDNSHAKAYVLNSMGETNRVLGQYNQANEYLQKALIIFQEIEDPEGKASVLANLGILYHSMTQYEKSIVVLQSAVSIFQQLRVLDGEARVWNSLGTSYQYLLQYDNALESFLKALSIFHKIKNRDGEAMALNNLGTLHGSLSQHTEAIRFFQQALPYYRSTGDRVGEGLALHNLGAALFMNGSNIDAEQTLFEAIATYDSIYDASRLELTDSQRRSLFENQMRTYQMLQQSQIALQKTESALETSERGRARALVELLEARLAGKSPQSTLVKQSPEKFTIPKIQQVVREKNATLVQYAIIFGKELYIYIILPSGKISFRIVDITKFGLSVNEFVNASRKAIGARDRGDIEPQLSAQALAELQAKQNQSLRQLHQLLIEPIADLLPADPNQRVVFLPQGELFLVPFPALLNAQNQPLITQHTILTAPSIQTLDLTHKAAQSLPKGDLPALVVGNPTMPAITTVIGNPPKTLTALVGAEKEAKAIAIQLNTQAITGANAKKAAIVQQMQTAGIIHLATHGLLDSFKGDAPGAIALAPNGTQEPNDGLLTTREIFDLKLTADLVVLSACDTGRGDISGDGVIGLSRSLFVAGVPSVIVSLWKVPDESTAFLMTEFYKNWKERKLDKAQALRQAMLTTRDKYPQPLDWAAFTLIGEAE
jgi:CHAT domain-containing protein